MTLETRLLQTIVSALNLEINSSELGLDEPLFEGGVEADSLAAVEICCAIEDEFDIEFDDDDFNGDTFSSVRTLANYLKSKI